MGLAPDRLRSSAGPGYRIRKEKHLSDALRTRLIAAMIHDAGGTDEPHSVAKNATLAAMAIMPILDLMKVPGAVRDGIDMKSDILAAQDLVSHAVDLLRRNRTDARGDLDQHISDLEELASELTETADEIGCTECGEYSNDGEGFDGLCGNCADRSDSDDEDPEHPRDHGDWPNVNDQVAMSIDEEAFISVAEVPEIQHGLKEAIWEIVDQNGDHHLIEDDGTRWVTVNPMTRDDAPVPGTPGAPVFSALFLEEGVDDGDGLGTRNWRGILTVDGQAIASTDLLSRTPQEACLEAVDLLPEDVA